MSNFEVDSSGISDRRVECGDHLSLFGIPDGMTVDRSSGVYSDQHASERIEVTPFEFGIPEGMVPVLPEETNDHTL